jgi:hypothetical protein
LLSALTPHALRARRRLRAQRKAADEELLQTDWVSPFLAWRVNELAARKNRLELARSLRGAVAAADARYLPSASPLNRVAVRSQAKRLLTIAKRLEDSDPVAPRGVLLVEQLLVDGFGPLYSREHADALPAYVDAARAALEPR